MPRTLIIEEDELQSDEWVEKMVAMLGLADDSDFLCVETVPLAMREMLDNPGIQVIVMGDCTPQNAYTILLAGMRAHITDDAKVIKVTSNTSLTRAFLSVGFTHVCTPEALPQLLKRLSAVAQPVTA